MSHSVILRASAGILPFSDKGKEEASAECDQAPIDQLSDEVLDLIFRYATSNCREKKTLCKLREVNGHWYNVIDTYHLRNCWRSLQKHIQHPILRGLVDQIVLVDGFVSEVIASAMDPNFAKLMGSEQACLLTKIDHMGPSACDRFALLTQSLRKQGAPIPPAHAVIGFDPSPYNEMQQRLDKALETIWKSIQKNIDFEEERVPDNAEAVRKWLNNPLNQEKIGLITKLDLSEMNLTVLPPEIGKLSQLNMLSLYGNLLTIIPSDIGKLSQLTHLGLSRNRLTTLPSEIGHCSKLTWLHLYKNQLATIPSEIGKLSQLKMLHLEQNRLTSLPPQIGNLSQLTELYLEENRLTSLPPEIGNLSQLYCFKLSGNWLTTLPPEIGNLSMLHQFDPSRNRLTSLPPQIGNLSQLYSFDLSENQLITLPPEVMGLVKKTAPNLKNNLLIYLLDGNFCHQQSNFQGTADKYLACSNYTCLTPLASLCQQILLGKETDLLRSTFKTLSNDMQWRIRHAWTTISSSSGSSSDLFDDRASFAEAVITTLHDTWHSLSKELRKQAYSQVAILAGKQERGASWGELYASSNILRFIDAMELAIPLPLQS